MAKKVYGVFVAGGSGVRMGTEVPKQFLELGGRPILQQSILKFMYAVPDLIPVLALPADHIATWKRLCVENRFDLPQIVVEGGITRFHSVRNALAKVPDGALVLIHDGVRPLISTDLIKRILDISAGERNVIPVMPVTDTLKSLVPAGDGTFVSSGDPDPDRGKLFGAQTPQLFLSEQIKKAYELGYNQSFTDDASVARAANIPLTYIAGERYNIKITTPEDLDLAEKLF
ncbi:MAG: 2-C-methyl-D-erythritol 4-phosphate cytidylyltransferase [Bacteroidales bacterium]|nr:2-C-methyl-D-erythritol 4-phosphate cytidylyltransferase [Bacteroidales bacterium]